MIEARDLSQRLEAAATAGVIDQPAADRLSAFLLQPSEANPHTDPDDEKLRLITGFNDIFVAIGLVMFLGALGFLTRDLGTVPAAALLAASAWILAEFFTRLRRMALPSIILLVVFAVSVFVAAGGLVSAGNRPLLPFSGNAPGPLFLGGIAMALAAGLHWLRFHVPITVAAGVAALAVILVAILSQFAPNLIEEHPVVVFLPVGLAIFALAMRFDMADRLRQTRRTDIAFWLHLLAAPIIVHPILLQTSGGGTASALMVLAVFLALSIVALVVDRRALLVSSLSYLAYAAGTLITAVGLENSSFAVSTLAVGFVVLLLSALWRPLRRAFVSLLPDTVRQRVPVAA